MEKIYVSFLSLFMAVILIVSTVLFWQNKNIEFIYYNIIFFLLLVFIVFTRRRLQLGVPVLLALLTLVIMHLLGGLVSINGSRLYDFVLGPLPFDKIHHFVLGMVFAFLTVSLFIDAKKWKENKKKVFFFFVILVSLGFGSVVEIFEYAGVELFNSPGVGDYANNATDLVADLLGSAVAAILMLLIKNGKNV